MNGPDQQLSEQRRRTGQALAGARKAAGMTQAEVADLLTLNLDGAYSQPVVARMESGKRSVSVSELLAFCRAVGVPPTHIVEALEIPSPRQSIEASVKNLRALESQPAPIDRARTELIQAMKACATIENDSAQSDPPNREEQKLYSSYVTMISRLQWIIEKLSHDQSILLKDSLFCLDSILTKMPTEDILNELNEAGRDYSANSDSLQSAIEYRNGRIATKLNLNSALKLTNEPQNDET